MSATAPDLKSVAEQVVIDRRHLHAHPELGFEEHATSQFVAERLRRLGIEVHTGVAGTGVVGLLHGARPGRCVMVRADMDALPIQEENDVEYRSRVDGVMHACGHDGHTAMLLNAARLLVERRDRLVGTVKFVFQPAEEMPPGGALRMIDEGVLTEPRVEAAFGIHLAQALPRGTVMAQAGPHMAASDRFRIAIQGKGGHAARPHTCVDAALISAQVLVALHEIVAREVRPGEPAVVTIGKIQAGTAPNVIPDTGLLEGTVRTFDPHVQDAIARRVNEIATGVARAMRATATVEYTRGYPALINDPAMTELTLDVAREVVGVANIAAPEASMGGEDFSRFLQRVPGCFFRLGTRNDGRGLVYGHHHPRFDIDEAALPIGVDLWVRLVERYLAG